MRHLTMTGFLMFALTAFCLVSQAQSGDSLRRQSVYYDAVVLYYATRNINAYPLAKDPVRATAASQDYLQAEVVEGGPAATTNVTGGQDNPGPAGSQPSSDSSREKPPAPDTTHTYYVIYESSTGKILNDNVPDTELSSQMRAATFATPAESEAFIRAVLSRNAGSDTLVSEEAIRTMYKSNPYFTDSIFRILTPSTGHQEFELLKQGTMFASSNGGGSGSVTDLIINGVTDYLVDQVNAEFDEAFLSRLKRTLAKSPALAVLFPETLSSLNKIKISQYTQALSTIRSAYQTDIRQLLDHVSGLATIPRVRDSMNCIPSLVLVFAACDIVSMLRAGLEPAEIMARLEEASYIRDFQGRNDYAAVLATAALLSNSLRDVHIGRIASSKDNWLPPARVSMLMRNFELFRLYLGLLVQNADVRGIRFSGHGAESSRLSEWLYFGRGPDLSRPAGYLAFNFLHTVDEMGEEVIRYRSVQTKAEATHAEIPVSVTAAFYSTMVNEFLSLAEDALDMAPSDQVARPRKVIDTIRGKYVPVLNQMNAVVSALEVRDYNLVVYHCDSILRGVLNKVVCDSFFKYGTFVSAVAMARTSDDVKMAIRSIALPTGSSRIKKEHGWSLGLNAYAGPYHANNQGYRTHGLPREEWGITAPIGLAYSRGLHHGSWGSLSLYGGLVDVGAIFTYKLNRDSSFVSGIELGQLLSPSVGLYWGAPVFGDGFNLPLSLGATYQWGPRLKRVSEKGNSVLPAMTSRFNVSLVFDLPILNFHVSGN